MKFPIDIFKSIFSEFSHLNDQVIEYEANNATCFIGEVNENDKYRLNEWFLFVAHLLTIMNMKKSGQTHYIVSSGSQDAISISLASPPSDDTFEYWLCTTSYGMQYLSYLKIKSPVGLYVCGSPQISAYRN